MSNSERRGGRNLTIDQQLGRAIRRLRLASGRSQADLGEAIGVSFQAVQKYESGENRVSASRLVQLAKLFAVPLAEFFSDADALPVEPEICSRWVTAAMMELARLSPGLRSAVLGLLRALNHEAGAPALAGDDPPRV
jgi:transcriptional regulator with XRE-family HTH domain